MTKETAPKHEFPCEYMIKIISHPDPAFPDDVLSLINSKTQIVRDQLTTSKNGNFISLSVVMNLQSEKILADIYQQLKQLPYIKMIM